MAPIGAFDRAKGESVIVHRCQSCDFERHNRVAGDDRFDLVAQLPRVPARGADGPAPEEKGHNPPGWQVA
jgi:RNHCP domain